MNWFNYTLHSKQEGIAYIFDYFIAIGWLVIAYWLLGVFVPIENHITAYDIKITMIAYLLVHDHAWYEYIKNKRKSR